LLLFLLFMCHVDTTSANDQPHDFSSLPPHIDTTSASSKAPKSLTNEVSNVPRAAFSSAGADLHHWVMLPYSGRSCHQTVTKAPFVRLPAGGTGAWISWQKPPHRLQPIVGVVRGD